MLKGNVNVKHPKRGRKRGATKEEMAQRLKGIISEIPIERIGDRERIHEELKRVSSLKVMDRTVERIEKEKRGTPSDLDDIIREMEMECERVLDSL